MDQWYLDNLVCPADKSALRYEDGVLISSKGRRYPVVEGIPVMLMDDVEQTMPLITASLERAKNNEDVIDTRASHLYLESLGISEKEKEGVVQLDAKGDYYVDPVVSYIIGATSGYAYKDLIGKIDAYPIPEIRLDSGNGKLLLDVGCNWGRWSIAASRKGYSVVGIDPSLGAVMAASRVAKQLGLPIRYVVGDSRFLPFRNEIFSHSFSYSVLQHLSKSDVRKALSEMSRVLLPKGEILIQMPNFLGIRSLQHQVKRKFRPASGFEVRYWSIPELRKTFDQIFTPSEISVDCYFGLGLQKSDAKYMSRGMKFVIATSEQLKKASKYLPFMTYFADSVYVAAKNIVE